MWKLHSLRRLIEQSVPELAQNPERLIVMADEGRVVTSLASGLSYEYQYDAEITILDYAGHTDALFVPLVAWLRVNQSDLLDNASKRERALQFGVNYLNTTSADIGISIPLTERAVVKADEVHPTRFNVIHPKEPCHPGMVCMPEHWELWLKDQKLAEWDIAPPPERSRFEV